MEKVYVDTALLAVPNYAIEQDAAQLLIDRVGHFALLALPQVPVDIVISANCEELLWSENCGPGYEEIAAFLHLMGIDEFYSPSDILQQYHAIFGRSQRSDAACEVEVFEYSELEIRPPLPSELVPSFLGVETKRTFATVAALQQRNNRWSLGSSLSQGTLSVHEVSVSILSTAGADASYFLPIPFLAKGTVRAITGLSDFVSASACARLWANAISEQDLCLSLALGAISIRRADRTDQGWEQVGKFSVGPSFLASLAQVQAFGSGRFSGAVRSLCTQLIAGTSKRHVGAFGRPSQVVRDFDGARGCRVHVTDGAEGLRLMFWKIGDSIELANVGVKKELVIEHGAPKKAVSIDLSELI